MDNEHSINLARTVGAGRDEEGGWSALREGETFGPFRIARLLGRGAMGEVYEAIRSGSCNLVALKVVASKLAHDRQAVERFRREAMSLRLLNSTNIVAAFETGEAEGRQWLSMLLCEGVQVVGADGEQRLARSLDEYASARGGRLSQTELLVLIEDILGGLVCAHERGIVHRDLKPANILLTRSFEGRPFKAMISDFGLVRIMGEQRFRELAEWNAGLSLTRAVTGKDAKAWLGNWAYMSPEQKRGQPATAVSDLYAVGLLAYRLGTGKDLGLESACELNADLVPEWDAFIGQALEESPDARYASARKMLDALGAVREAYTWREDAKRVAATSSLSRKAIALAALAGVALLAFGAVKAVGFLRTRRGAERMAATETVSVSNVVSDSASARQAETEQSAKVAAALEAARQVKVTGEKQAYTNRAAEALALEADNGETPALKAEAEKNLNPALTVEVEADGDTVAAEISDNRHTYASPHTFELVPGSNYTFVVSMESKETGESTGSIRSDALNRLIFPKHYKPVVFEITADWRGPKTRRVALEEIKGTVEEQPWSVPDLGLALMPVAPGSFQMGPDIAYKGRKTVQTVRLTQTFWMGKTEVTQREYAQLMDGNPSHVKGDSLPVVLVSWDDAAKFCEELTRREQAAGRLLPGYVYRLPTEAEWEYAARGGAKSRGYTYAGGNDLDAVAWYYHNSDRTTHVVGAKAANELGLFDMSGNIEEWCLDWYQEGYGGLAMTDPTGPATGSLRVVRGGRFDGSTSISRLSSRRSFRPSDKLIGLGFRVVLAAERTTADAEAKKAGASAAAEENADVKRNGAFGFPQTNALSVISSVTPSEDASLTNAVGRKLAEQEKIKTDLDARSAFAANRGVFVKMLVGQPIVRITPSSGAFDSDPDIKTNWNAAADFSIAKNPSGAWSYGLKRSVAGLGFELMTLRWGTNGYPHVRYLGSELGYPCVQHGLNLWASNNSQGRPTVRWTCPVDGKYEINGQFKVGGRGGHIVAYVVTNGYEMASEYINGPEAKFTFTNRVSLMTGAVLDFVIEYGGAGSSAIGWTMFQAAIDKR